MIATLRQLIVKVNSRLIRLQSGRSTPPPRITVVCQACGKRIANVAIEGHEGSLRLNGIASMCVRVDFISQDTIAFVHADVDVCDG
jgi:hypothetical protein